MDPTQLSPQALALIRAYFQRYSGGSPAAAGANAIAPQGQAPLQYYRAASNAADAMGMNDVQRATGLNLDPNVGLGSLFQTNLPPQRRIQEDFRQFPGYY